MPDEATPPAPSLPSPKELVKSKQYIALLVMGALVGIPVAVVAYYYLKLIDKGQNYFFSTLPNELGFRGAPVWWPIPMLVLCGLVVGATLRYLPGSGGHNPAEGFAIGGQFTPRDLPSVVVASLTTLILGGVLGPEMPLVVIGMVLAVLIVHLIKKDAPKQAVAVIGAAGSFAAISSLLGSPLVGAFLLLEAAGIGGGLISVILLPGLVASGIGALVFVALSKFTTTGIISFGVPNLPKVGFPTWSTFAWSIPIGLVAAVVGTAIRRGAFQIQPITGRRKLLVTPALGLVIGGLAVFFAEETGKSSHFVLFSGQSGLSPLIDHAATWSLGALVLLIVCKGLAYGASLAGFKGGPVFPGMFLGAAVGIVFSHFPGLSLVDSVAMGIGAMLSVVIGGLPLSSVLLTLVFIQSDAFEVISVVILAVAVSFVAAAWLERWLKPASHALVPASVAPGEPGAAAGAASDSRSGPAASESSPQG